jgi:hypothetical protein
MQVVFYGRLVMGNNPSTDLALTKCRKWSFGGFSFSVRSPERIASAPSCAKVSHALATRWNAMDPFKLQAYRRIRTAQSVYPQ